MGKHQVGPFSVGDSGTIYDCDALEFADTYGGGEQKFANAEFIVRACNSHADLLAALEAMTQAYQQHFDAMPVAWQTFDNIAQEAIARARGQ